MYLYLEDADFLGEGARVNLYLPAGTFLIMLLERVCIGRRVLTKKQVSACRFYCFSRRINNVLGGFYNGSYL